ncbi:hypothetical protein BDV27DRAFT_72401 [Aspergillus caelatus]|uniref:Secreted protein n=1 Tax=Aspergillus caelatus TaxID=61420 RepID=A0A5N6ZLU9_9EURO|nr:uncharacterized protein BDV27DRAFT_72401 [Aspergillus caelatus]KAE8358193.1 hypothetical protein BDV27DRAFT_72401 [Aspergillus caelatus]
MRVFAWWLICLFFVSILDTTCICGLCLWSYPVHVERKGGYLTVFSVDFDFVLLWYSKGLGRRRLHLLTEAGNGYGRDLSLHF